MDRNESDRGALPGAPVSVERYKPVFDEDDDCWRVAAQSGRQGIRSAWDTLGWMRFATREAAEQWIERETGVPV
jgi:hypothetical protein